jgi:hypothetical protein
MKLNFPDLANEQSLLQKLPLNYFSNFLNYIEETKDIKKCYKNIHLENSHLIIDFYKFEYKIPTKFFTEIKKCLENKEINLIIIPISLHFPRNINHYNILIINKIEGKRVEYFEPHGTNFIFELPSMYEYKVYDTIQNILKQHLELNKYKFINANQKCPRGLQFKQTQVFQIRPPKNYGLCVAWCLLIIHLRILNPKISINYIVEIILYNNTPTELHDIITKYIKFVEKKHVNNNYNIETFETHKLILPQNEIDNIYKFIYKQPLYNEFDSDFINFYSNFKSSIQESESESD